MYRDNDSTYFVFRALDYIKVNGNDTLPLIRSDSTDEKNFKRFSLTLTNAASTPCTLMDEVLYKGARLFPNSFVVKELFASHEVFVFKSTAGALKKVDYTTKKKRGKNVKWQFSVIDKQNKNVLFKTAYGGIYNWGGCTHALNKNSYKVLFLPTN